MSVRTFSFLVISMLSFASHAQDSLSTVYFYRQAGIQGALIGYDITTDNKIVGHIKSKSVFVYQSRPGMQTFTASTEGTTSVTLNMVAGKSYFVECKISMGAIAGRPTLYQVKSSKAKKDIEGIDSTTAAKIIVEDESVIQRADTVRALHNLYQRKRRNGVVRSVVFGALGVISLVNTLNPPTNTVTVTSPGGGSQTLDTSDSGDPANYIFISFSAVMVITGITQNSKYSNKNLQGVLDGYDGGKPLPVKIKSKFKKKDFR